MVYAECDMFHGETFNISKLSVMRFERAEDFDVEIRIFHVF